MAHSDLLWHGAWGILVVQTGFDSPIFSSKACWLAMEERRPGEGDHGEGRGPWCDCCCCAIDSEEVEPDRWLLLMPYYNKQPISTDGRTFRISVFGIVSVDRKKEFLIWLDCMRASRMRTSLSISWSPIIICKTIVENGDSNTRRDVSDSEK